VLHIRSEKDFWAGLLYCLFAAGFFWFGKEYRFGTAARMGPGYFPVVLSGLLFVFGFISIVRSFLKDGEPVGTLALKPMALIVAGAVAFGWLLPRAGLVFALPTLVLLSASASRFSVYTLKSFALLGLLALFCVLVFIKGLGVPMPIFGPWFDGLVPSWLQR